MPSSCGRSTSKAWHSRDLSSKTAQKMTCFIKPSPPRIAAEHIAPRQEMRLHDVLIPGVKGRCGAKARGERRNCVQISWQRLAACVQALQSLGLTSLLAASKQGPLHSSTDLDSRLKTSGADV